MLVKYGGRAYIGGLWAKMDWAMANGPKNRVYAVKVLWKTIKKC